MGWFDVDKEGLAKILERRGKEFILFELVSNCLDTEAKRIDVTLTKHAGAPKATIVVADDDPEGFENLSHAFTLFAESSRKGDQSKRGRFNFGEKIVLAGCYEAQIESTTGTVEFGKNGRRVHPQRKIAAGSVFTGVVRMTVEEYEAVCPAALRILPPEGVTITFNGQEIPHRKPATTIPSIYLATVAPDKEGFLARTYRSTELVVYEPLPGEAPMLYELGIPVVETGDRWHVDVRQKVPVNLDRDNVGPGYLRDIRVAVVNALAEQLTQADAGSTFVGEALADKNIEAKAVDRALTLRYGERRAIFDPSDPEANNRLVAEGYNLIHGGHLTKDQWENVRRAGAARPAGQISPTKKARFSPDGVDYWIPESKWTYAMQRIVQYIRTIAPELLGREVSVGILDAPPLDFLACYGDGQLTLNLARLGSAWFDKLTSDEAVNSLLIHELAHEYEGNHLSDKFHEACCNLGARLAKLFYARPDLVWHTPAYVLAPTPAPAAPIPTTDTTTDLASVDDDMPF